VSVTNVRIGVFGAAPVSATISARMRSCATANGPSYISNAIRRLTAVAVFAVREVAVYYVEIDIGYCYEHMFHISNSSALPRLIPFG
jgi:hypothetical protein